MLDFSKFNKLPMKRTLELARERAQRLVKPAHDGVSVFDLATLGNTEQEVYELPASVKEIVIPDHFDKTIKISGVSSSYLTIYFYGHKYDVCYKADDLFILNLAHSKEYFQEDFFLERD